MSGDDAPVVLLLEDDEGLARAMGRNLELAGFRVVHAPNGHEARRVVEGEEPVDLLIADLILPGLGGRETANLIAARRPEIRILFTTGFSRSDPELRELMEAGYPVLRKPYSPPELIAAVRDAIGMNEEDPAGE